MKIEPLAEPAIARRRRRGAIEIVPENWSKTYFEWMYNIRDWCISRQLWWGHRIPAWYCGMRQIIVAREDADACARCGADRAPAGSRRARHVVQLGPLAVLDARLAGSDGRLATLLSDDRCSITGFDILFFWVARMIMMGLEFMGDVPFRTGLPPRPGRDAEGQKMSKTKGNVIDPLDGHGKVRNRRRPDGADAWARRRDRHRDRRRPHRELPRVCE